MKETKLDDVEGPKHLGDCDSAVTLYIKTKSFVQQ